MQHLSHKSADIRSEQLSGAGKTRQYSTAPHGSGPVKLPSASFLQKYDMLEHHCPSLLHFKVCVSSRSISSLHLYVRTFDAHVMSHFPTACDAHPSFYGHEPSDPLSACLCRWRRRRLAGYRLFSFSRDSLSFSVSSSHLIFEHQRCQTLEKTRTTNDTFL